MLRATSRVFVLTGTLLSAVLMAPTVGQAQGLFDWLGCGQTRTAYSPVVAAPNACNTCPTTTVNYVPRTSYRLGFVDVPVTRMRPVASCDPCTGTAVTAYRPTTEYVKRLRFVPQTTYRAVTVPTTVRYAPVAACNTCPTTVGYAAPSAYYSPTSAYAAPGCSSCGTSAPGMTPTPTYTPAPAASYTPSPAPATYTQPGTTYAQPAPSQATPTPTYTQPAPSQTPVETGEPRTFRRPESAAPSGIEQGPELQPIPDSTKGAPSLFRAPQLVDPQDQTAQSGSTSWKVAKAVHVQAAEPTQEELDADGWRSAEK